MFSFRSLALVLAIAAGAAVSASAQESSSASSTVSSSALRVFAESSSSLEWQQTSAPQGAGAAGARQSQPGFVQRAGAHSPAPRRRRAQAIQDVYSHLYEAYIGMGYMRFVPGPNQQRTTMYAWNAEFTRYYKRALRRYP